MNQKVIVVGAGIAGLAAAWHLKKSGIQALVLEADQSVGGRMKSCQIGDALIDTGAQFLSSAYSIIPELIKDAGLTDEFVFTKEKVGFVRNKKVSIIHSGKPWQLVTHNLLSIRALIRLAWEQVKAFTFRNNQRSLSDISHWVEHDNVSATQWINQTHGDPSTLKLIETLMNGFYFQSLKQSSASFAAAVMAFSAHCPKTMTLTAGMASLPLKLAESLTIKTDVTVTQIQRVASELEVTTADHSYFADHVILTVPAPVAKTLVKSPDENSLCLFNTQYSASATIAVLVHESWTPPEEIISVYGILFNLSDDHIVAALTLEKNKHPSRKQKGYLINVMLSNEGAQSLLNATNKEILSAIQADVELVLPEVYQHLQLTQVYRWPYAMPLTPLGRALQVKRYRDSRNTNHRIWLAGDYMGFPWTDSAAQTGIWAAEQVCLSLKHY